MTLRLLAVLGLIASTVAPAAAGELHAPRELHAYVGAGLRQPVTAIAEAFEKETGTKVRLEFGGSGQILARFEAAGAGDLFIPGSTFYTARLEKEGLVASQRIAVRHGPVLAVTRAKADEIRTFEDLAKPGVRFGIGDPEAMALGRTAETILDNSGLGEQIRANITVRAATVKQLALYVFDGNVDAAIISASGAAMNRDKISVIAIPQDWYTAEQVPVVVLTTSEDREAAEAFAARLSSPEGLAVWTRFGFQPADAD